MDYLAGKLIYQLTSSQKYRRNQRRYFLLRLLHYSAENRKQKAESLVNVG